MGLSPSTAPKTTSGDQDRSKMRPANVALQALALIAPQLGAAELRIFLHFAAHDLGAGYAISTRAIAGQVRLAPSNVPPNIKKLVKRGLLKVHPRCSRRKPLSYGVRLEQVHSEPDQAHSESPEPLQQVHSEPQQYSLQVHSEPLEQVHSTSPYSQQVHSEPLQQVHSETPINMERVCARVGIDSDSDSIIDRALKAKETDYEAGTLEAAKRAIRSYYAKNGRGWDDLDDTITAQIVAAAQPETVGTLCSVLIADRIPPGDRNSYLVTLALQRVHGIQPKQVQARRAVLKAGTLNASAATAAGTLGSPIRRAQGMARAGIGIEALIAKAMGGQ